MSTSTDQLIAVLAPTGVAAIFGWMWIAAKVDAYRAKRRQFARRRARLEREANR